VLTSVVARLLVLALIKSLALPLADATRPVRAKSETRTVTRTFSNTGVINIPGTGIDTFGIANPYPSTIQVSGLKKGKILDVNVHLDNLTHPFPDDIDILLAATQIPGVNAIIMSDVGDADPNTVNVNLVFNDAAPSPLPDESTLSSGSFQPTNFPGDDAVDLFPAPAPPPTGGSTLAIFNGHNPNGTWQLFVNDDEVADRGTLAGG
jgi:subtilisin-like proprotein convertase family protein